MRSSWFGRIVLFAALVPAACGPAASTPGATTPLPTTPVPTTPDPTASKPPPAPTAVPATATARPVSALEGTWATGVIDQGDVEATLEEQGLGDWIDEFRSQTPIAAGMKLVLEIQDGQWDLYGETAGGKREPIDYEANYGINGNEVSVIHADGHRTLGWTVDGDTLTIESKNTTLSDTEGIPDEVFQVALYMTEDFVREP